MLSASAVRGAAASPRTATSERSWPRPMPAAAGPPQCARATPAEQCPSRLPPCITPWPSSAGRLRLCCSIFCSARRCRSSTRPAWTSTFAQRVDGRIAFFSQGLREGARSSLSVPPGADAIFRSGQRNVLTLVESRGLQRIAPGLVVAGPVRHRRAGRKWRSRQAVETRPGFRDDFGFRPVRTVAVARCEVIPRLPRVDAARVDKMRAHFRPMRW